MTQPSTGTTFPAGGFNEIDNRYNQQRTGLIAAFVRDARGAATNISPHNPDGSVAWSPLAQDGQLRDDLKAFILVNGAYVPNPEPNEGWHITGAFAEGDGPTTKPSIDTDEQMVEQTNWVFDFDTTKEDEPVSFTAIETARPTIRRLRNNLPLSRSNGDLLVETPGGADAGWSRPLDPTAVDRQLLLVSARKRGGQTIYEIEGYDCLRLSDIGDAKKGKKGTASELTFRPLPSNYFMAMQDGEYIPIIKYTWIGGDGWTALGTPIPAEYDVILGTQASGTFTLTFRGNVTTAIAYNATPAVVKAALVALDDGFSAADWTVTGSNGGPYTVITPGGALTGFGASLGTPGNFEIEAA